MSKSATSDADADPASPAPLCRPPRAESIELIGGDPDLDWASHTSLLLPFSYRLHRRAAPCGNTPAWCQTDIVEKCLGSEPRYDESLERTVGGKIPERERFKYFTADTANVLYGRSRRFVLKGERTERRVFALERRDQCAARDVAVQFKAPELWLFEFDHALAARNGDEQPDDTLACGILRVEFYFAPDQQVYLSDLLKLNEKLRYLRLPYHDFKDDGVRLTRCGAHLAYWLELLEAPLCTDGEHFALLGPGEAEVLCRQWDQQGARTSGWKAGGKHTTALMHDDDRAFVSSTAIARTSLGDAWPPGQAVQPDAFPAWVALLNVDYGANPQTTAFEAEWAKPRSYTRWAHYGTLYGFTSHSSCVLMNINNYSPVWLHTRSMYLDQTRLLLYVRSTVYRFSNRLVEHAVKQRASRDNDRGERKQLLCDAESLLSQLADFINLYQFPLLSNQQQAVELYALQRRHLDIDDLFMEVQREAEGTHRHLDVQRTRWQADFATRIQNAGFPVAAAALTSAVLAIAPISGWLNNRSVSAMGVHMNSAGLALSLVVLASALAAVLVMRRMRALVWRVLASTAIVALAIALLVSSDDVSVANATAKPQTTAPAPINLP
jgi:hypothetical protein